VLDPDVLGISMKPSERLKLRLAKLENDIYDRLGPGGQRVFNRVYRGSKKASEKVRERAPAGRAELHKRVLRSTASLDEIVMRDVVGYTDYRSKPKKKVGK